MTTAFPNPLVLILKVKGITREKSVWQECQLLPMEQKLELDIHVKNILCW